MQKSLFVIQTRIAASPNNPDPAARMTDGGSAHGLVFSTTAREATVEFIRHLRTNGWSTERLVLCQQTHPERAIGHPPLERLLAEAMQHGVASEVVGAAFREDPGQAM
jgi:hypothetical protein